jgi:hypothetical protein
MYFGFEFYCMLIILAVFYMFNEFAGYSVDSRISHGACKLARTLRIIKKSYTENPK